MMQCCLSAAVSRPTLIGSSLLAVESQSNEFIAREENDGRRDAMSKPLACPSSNIIFLFSEVTQATFLLT